jgi:hypothetical protein
VEEPAVVPNGATESAEKPKKKAAAVVKPKPQREEELDNFPPDLYGNPQILLVYPKVGHELGSDSSEARFIINIPRGPQRMIALAGVHPMYEL